MHLLNLYVDNFPPFICRDPSYLGISVKTAAPVGRAWVLSKERGERKPWVDIGDGLSFPPRYNNTHYHATKELGTSLKVFALCCFNGKYNL